LIVSSPKRHLTLSRPALVHPLWFLLLALVLATLPAVLSTSTQREEWGQDWIFTANDLLMQTLGFGALALGLAVSGRAAPRPWVEFTEEQLDRLEKLTRVLFWLSTTAYVIWFGLGTLRNGSAFLLGSSAEAQKVGTIPGVTTLTQVGPYVIAACSVLSRLGRPHRVMLTTMLALGGIRVFANSERLALLELFLPLLVVAALVPPHRQRNSVKVRRRWPSGLVFAAWTATGLAALIGFFAFSERTRSWTFYSSRTDHGLLAFSADRLQAYYATATNNGALYLHGLSPNLVRPETTLQFLWEFPVIGGPLRGIFGGDPRPLPDVWLQYLSGHSNPEFNNTGGILPLFGELHVLAPVLLLLIGIGLGRVYRNACSGSLAAMLGYAVVAIGVLELPRFFYYGQGRAFPVLLAGLLGAAYLKPPTNEMITENEELIAHDAL
jgi:hypothetical protein